MAKKSKGKWATAGLPEAQPEFGEWFNSVLEEMAQREGKPIRDLAEEYNSLKAEKAELDAQRSGLTAKIEALDRLILNQLEYQGLDSVEAEGQTFSPRHDLEVRVTDKVALRGWCERTGREDLLTVNNGAAAGLAREAIDPEMVELIAGNMTLAERAALQPGEPGSAQLPPGITASVRKTLGRRTS